MPADVPDWSPRGGLSPGVGERKRLLAFSLTRLTACTAAIAVETTTSSRCVHKVTFVDPAFCPNCKLGRTTSVDALLFDIDAAAANNEAEDDAAKALRR